MRFVGRRNQFNLRVNERFHPRYGSAGTQGGRPGAPGNQKVCLHSSDFAIFFVVDTMTKKTIKFGQTNL